MTDWAVYSCEQPSGASHAYDRRADGTPLDEASARQLAQALGVSGSESRLVAAIALPLEAAPAL